MPRSNCQEQQQAFVDLYITTWVDRQPGICRSLSSPALRAARRACGLLRHATHASGQRRGVLARVSPVQEVQRPVAEPAALTRRCVGERRSARGPLGARRCRPFAGSNHTMPLLRCISTIAAVGSSFLLECISTGPRPRRTARAWVKKHRELQDQL